MKYATKEKLIEFYEKCEKEGIKELRDPFLKKKASQIAETIGICDISDIDDLFEIAKKNTFEERNRIKREGEERIRLVQIDKANKEDPKDYDLLSKYSDLYGNDKPIVMLNDQYAVTIGNLDSKIFSYMVMIGSADAFSRNAHQYKQYLHEKEYDWAVAGGIAQGIAGPAAGLANALDAQQKNVAVHQKNAGIDAVIDKLAVKGLIQSYDWSVELSKVKSQKQELENELQNKTEKLKYKVVGEENDSEAFSNIQIISVDYTISPIGSVRIFAKVYQKTPCYIYGNKAAYVDGTLAAKVFQNGVLIGVADLVLPFEGLKNNDAKNPLTLEGICLYNADPKESCTIEIIPKNLWKIEE